jgi:hypothetical protein
MWRRYVVVFSLVTSCSTAALAPSDGGTDEGQPDAGNACTPVYLGTAPVPFGECCTGSEATWADDMFRGYRALCHDGRWCSGQSNDPRGGPDPLCPVTYPTQGTPCPKELECRYTCPSNVLADAQEVLPVTCTAGFWCGIPQPGQCSLWTYGQSEGGTDGASDGGAADGNPDG